MRDLTIREAHLLAGIAEGMTNEELATAEGIQPNTIKVRVSRLLRKMGARSRAHAVAVGYQRGLLASKGPEEIQQQLKVARQANAGLVLKVERLKVEQARLVAERDRLREQNRALGALVPWNEVAPQ